jgi:hypothetical protein
MIKINQAKGEKSGERKTKTEITTYIYVDEV